MWFSRLRVGQSGERAAAKYLRRAGVRIIARNYRCPAGELDLIGLDGWTIVFFEVKTLTSDRDADPEGHINPAKQRQLERVARYWLAAHKQPGAAYRFDAMSVVRPPNGQPIIRRIVEAFIPRTR